MAEEEDLYTLLGVEYTSTTEVILKAYRKKSLKYHPDKLSEKDADKLQIFHKLTDAKNLLIDEKQRAAYDEKLKAKLQAKRRVEEMNNARREMKQKLERQELGAKAAAVHAANQEKAKKERLREETREMRRQMQESLETSFETKKEEQQRQQNHAKACVKVQWGKKDDVQETQIRSVLARYGTVSDVVLSKGRPSAMVVFASPESAQQAVAQGVDGFVVSWPKSALNNNESTDDGDMRHGASSSSSFSFSTTPSKSAAAGGGDHSTPLKTPSHRLSSSTPASAGGGGGGGRVSLEDYENDTLKRMLEASRAKRQRQEENNTTS